MALYARFHDQILPLQSKGGDFVVNLKGYLAYKKDMTNTFCGTIHQIARSRMLIGTNIYS